MLNNKGLNKELGKSIYVDDAESKIISNSIYVTLGNELKVYSEPILDVKKTNTTKRIIIPEEGFILEPNKLYLGRTNEYTKTYGYVPLLSNLLDLAVLGLDIHITAGFGDNGFEGTWTLEITCTNPTIVRPGMIIGQISYYPLIGDPSIKYEGKYLGQVAATESRIERDFQKSIGGKKC